MDKELLLELHRRVAVRFHGDILASSMLLALNEETLEGHRRLWARLLEIERERYFQELGKPTEDVQGAPI